VRSNYAAGEAESPASVIPIFAARHYLAVRLPPRIAARSLQKNVHRACGKVTAGWVLPYPMLTAVRVQQQTYQAPRWCCRNGRRCEQDRP
jgi:hypothetical protein